MLGNPEIPMNPEEMGFSPDVPEHKEESAEAASKAEASPETVAGPEVRTELENLEGNVALVEQAAEEFDGPQDMADLARDLTAEQKQLLKDQITKLQAQISDNKYAARMSLSLANPFETIYHVTNPDPRIEPESKAGAALAYASGLLPSMGITMSVEKGMKILRDKYKLGKVQRKLRKMERG